MEFQIADGRSYATLEVTMDSGDRVGIDPGSMVTRSDAIRSETNASEGGLGGMLKRAVSDELEVMTTFLEAETDGSRAVLAPDYLGDIAQLDIDETGPVKVQSGGLLAWTPDVERGTARNEASNFFSSGELTVLRLGGSGTAFISAFGAVREERVTSDEPLVVDEDHLLAWSEDLSVSRAKDSSIKSSLLGGEGFVTRLEGDGRVWVQTRDPMILFGGGGQ
ncbi:TIGR00266 family protein [Halogranum gelatinilyticum]|uniref:TIGR00266 family protein n=1 Tax=Halogranum gelatinilyticum TaxID=660521 RepID=A0A1G9XY74_9EURY|nr:TIGR00266 family protein [Halogranum gelatinilyticum]SDN01737.1 TIGR00266 family protein [Halogranum gelatinilyticum]